MTFRELLVTEFGCAGSLTPEQVDMLERHYRLLQRWNKRLNLTRITGLAEVVRFHYCESLFLGRTLPPGHLVVGDAGSGGGFPGIPVAILRPDIEMVLIESDQRKAVFLREASRELGNVRVFGRRFERHPNRLDWVVSRAVAPSDVEASEVAANFAILTSAEHAPAGSEIIRLPWGRDRVIAVLHVKHSRNRSRSPEKSFHVERSRDSI